MKRGHAFALAAALCACAPAPAQMTAAQASEVLNLFAAGRGPANLCSDDGRAVLRGAVRAYSQEMSTSGVDWPAIGADGGMGELTHVEASVVFAYAAGFVRPGDLQHTSRRSFMNLAFSGMPEVLSLRRAARVACEDVEALQRAAARYLMEGARWGEMTRAARVRSQGAETVNRLRRQSERVNRAREDVEMHAAIVRTRMEENQLLPLD